MLVRFIRTNLATMGHHRLSNYPPLLQPPEQDPGWRLLVMLANGRIADTPSRAVHQLSNYAPCLASPTWYATAGSKFTILHVCPTYLTMELAFP